MKKLAVFLGIALFAAAAYAQQPSAQEEVERLQRELAEAQAKQAEIERIQRELSEAQAKMQSESQNQQNPYGQPYWNQQNPYGQPYGNQQNPYGQPYGNQQNPYGNQNGQLTFAPGSIELFNQIDMLIDDSLFDNKEAIAQIALGLDPMQRQMMFNKHEKSGGLGFALNALVGWGIGSFVMGDKGGGAFQCVFDGVGMLFLLIGLLSDDSSTMGPLVAIGACSFLTATIYGLIRPWVYANRYNKTLEGTLQGNPLVFEAVPIIDPINKNIGFAARLVL